MELTTDQKLAARMHSLEMAVKTESILHDPMGTISHNYVMERILKNARTFWAFYSEPDK